MIAVEDNRFHSNFTSISCFRRYYETHLAQGQLPKRKKKKIGWLSISKRENPAAMGKVLLTNVVGTCKAQLTIVAYDRQPIMIYISYQAGYTDEAKQFFDETEDTV